MKTRTLLIAMALLILVLRSVADTKPDRKWHMAQLREIQRQTPIWKWTLTSDGLIYMLEDRQPYLNPSLGSQVQIAAVNGSDAPYSGDQVYVLDSKGQEHRLDIDSVAMADDPCKK